MELGVTRRALIVARLKDRYGDICFLCSKPFQENNKATIDHLVPRSRGGSDKIENLRLMCKRCNQFKNDRIMLPDGTLEPVVKLVKSQKVDRGSILGRLCIRCLNGRLLNQGEVCVHCLSSPGPVHGVWWRKSDPKHCSHLSEWCSSCSSGAVERIIPISALAG